MRLKCVKKGRVIPQGFRKFKEDEVDFLLKNNFELFNGFRRSEYYLIDDGRVLWLDVLSDFCEINNDFGVLLHGDSGAFGIFVCDR